MKYRGISRRGRPLEEKTIKFHSDYQQNWPRLIRPLKRTEYTVNDTSSLTIVGDAPKCFLHVREFLPGKVNRQAAWPKYIAKLGSKSYPLESITEHLIGRVGNVFGFDVAESRLAIVRGKLCFLSRYFLSKDQSLVHGLEIFRDDFGDEMVTDIAAAKAEQEFYTFPAVVRCLEEAYPNEGEEIAAGFVRMLVFDGLVGNNDRHPANWGVVTSVRADVPSRFSPIFDSARGLFWNNSEDFVKVRLSKPELMAKYIDRSRPQIGWDGEPGLDHFALLGKIFSDYPKFRPVIEQAAAPLRMDSCGKMMLEEFGALLSSERLTLIQRCLEARLARIKRIITS